VERPKLIKPNSVKAVTKKVQLKTEVVKMKNGTVQLIGGWIDR